MINKHCDLRPQDCSKSKWVPALVDVILLETAGKVFIQKFICEKRWKFAVIYWFSYDVSLIYHMTVDLSFITSINYEITQ